MTPERILKWERHRSGAKVGVPIRREAPEIFLVVPSTFLALKVQLVVLVSAFVIVSTVWSVSCLLFFYSRDQPFVKVGGGHVPPCPMESAPLSVGFVGHSRAYALATIITVNLKYRSTVVFYCRWQWLLANGRTVQVQFYCTKLWIP